MIPFQYALANAFVCAAIVAIAWGSWPIWIVLAAIYLMGGPLDEAVGDTSDTPRRVARWFCDANLYLTLPLLLLLTFVTLNGLKGKPSEISGWFGGGVSLRQGLDVAAATFLVGSCYAMFGATVAHELTHRPGRLAQWPAQGLLALMGNSSFTVFHVHGHHRYVGTLRDPATARRGEHILAFFLRTFIGQFRDAFRHEATRLRSAGHSPWSLSNRVIGGQLVTLAYVAAAAGIAGWVGVVALLSAGAIGRVLHEFVNYIQHYGLARIEGTPIAERHTWDSYRTVSNIMHYNLPRHADHHLFATKPFWQLAPAAHAPTMPHGYLTMVLIALIPQLWRRSMAPLLADWDELLASDAERAEIRQRGWDKLC